MRPRFLVSAPESDGSGMVAAGGPRTRGEYASETLDTYADLGSSPHMRGVRGVVIAATEAPGTIPAHAGSTTEETETWYVALDHPRTCGEYGLSPAS